VKVVLSENLFTGATLVDGRKVWTSILKPGGPVIKPQDPKAIAGMGQYSLQNDIAT